MRADRAIYVILIERLKGATLAGDRVYAMAIPPGVTRPYVRIAVVGGGKTLVTPTRETARFTVQVEFIDDNLVSAYEGGDLVRQLLDEQGIQKLGGLVGNAGGWVILSCTVGTLFVMDDMAHGSNYAVYRVGADFDLVMERV